MVQRKRRWKKTVPFALALACLFAASVPAMADDAIDLGKSGSVSIAIRAYATDEAVGGGSLYLYRVADLGDDNGYFYYTYTESFSGCGEELLNEDELDQAETAETFSAWVKEHGVSVQESVAVSETGRAYFADLSCGLYLVTQNETAEGYHAINAFLVSVPLNEDGTWMYDVNATPKTSPVMKAATVEPKEEPKGELSHLGPSDQSPDGTGKTISGSGTGDSGNAKTGDYNYFIYGILAIGAVLVIVVLLRRRSNRTAR